jgi:hypothetical protein
MHMSLQVYFHRATRGWEAHLLCLFNLAARLAKENSLPDATPAVVRSFFSGVQKLTHDEFLVFDESVLMYALHVWATAREPKSQRLAEVSAGFLNRRKSFIAQDLKPMGFTQSTRLQRELSAHGIEGIDWLLDEINFNSYKDFGAVFQSGERVGPEDISTRAILLADGKLGSPSRPVESKSHLFAEMGRHPVESVTRLYYHCAIREPVQKVLEAF